MSHDMSVDHDPVSYPTTVVGDQLGLAFPTTIESLQQQGIEFLTRAFHTSGVMQADNRVSAITGFKEFFGGGMGRKLLLSVSYLDDSSSLHRDLFVKFPRDFGDPLRSLFGPLMEPEVRFSLLSRRPDFPIAVPKCYFADYNAETTSGILITARVPYGKGDIEPAYDKCLDYEIPDLLGHYQALARTAARLAGHHKAGKFGADTERQFPFEPQKVSDGFRIPHTAEQLREKLDKLLAFADKVPQLFPAELRDTAFLDRFVSEVPQVLEKEAAIMAHLNSRADFVALCHWNMNVDNAWFWNGEQGREAGLLDWGSVGQMNVAQALYGMFCAAETDFLNAHRHELIELFATEYRQAGGPRIEAEELRYLYKLAVAVLGVAWILDAPSLIEAELPGVQEVNGRFDSRLRDVFLARAQMQLLLVLLNEWRHEDIGRAITDFPSRPARV